MIKTVRIAIATALLLAAGNAAALGLGQIEVKSRINQPLLAEIPIISTVPGELQALQARLASPETFRRVGLAPPTGLAGDLQFSLGSDARGRPVIRVTTTAPVNQAVLNFLIEVDWGQGRLVREYSALVDAPRTASAPVQPAISAPVVAAPNVVQRPAPVVAAPVVAAPPAPTPARVLPATPPPPAPLPQPAPAPEPAAASTSLQALGPPARPAAVAARPVTAMPASPASAPAQYGPVKRGETLSRIASELPVRAGYTLDQTMLALLRANPEAFLGQDMNQLRQGAVLRVPGSSEVAGIDADEAALVVREQMREWRQARRALVQPDQAPVAPRALAATPESTAATRPAAARQPAPVRRQPAQARLAIVPPSAPGTATGTRSGTSAGGEGTMLQQQLRQRDEDLAARQAEIGELKDRVAELENLQKQQQQLLAMKDSELAAAQQRLAETRKAEAAAAAGVPAATAPAPAAQERVAVQVPQANDSAATSRALPWVWGSLALIVLALLAWLLSRRSSATVVAPRRAFDSRALAASMILPEQDGSDALAAARRSNDSAPELRASTSDRSAGDAGTHVDHVPTTEPTSFETPAWHSRDPAPAVPEPETVVAAASNPRFVPVDPGDPLEPQANADQKLKLAVAFLDIGDDRSAESLLRELLDDADPATRAEAALMLRGLG